MPEQPVSNLAFYNARPILEIDSQANDLARRLLVSLEMTESEGGMSALEMRLRNVAPDPSRNADLAWDDGQVLRLGAELKVLAGDDESPQEIFRGVVTALEGHFPEDDGPELVVLAEDALQRARMQRRTAVHVDATLSGLAEAVAQRLGLTPQVTGLSQSVGTQVQLDESDLSFLRRVLATHGADLQVVGRELHAAARADIQRGTLELALHSQLRSARLLADLAHQATTVTTAGWNPAQGTTVQAQSSGSQLGPGSGTAGAGVLQQALATRSEHVRDLAVMTQDEAQALADAAFDQRARRFVTVEGTAEGNAALRVGTHITLVGISSRWDNTYYVVRATHRFHRDEGYRTDFEAECAYLGGN